VPRTLAVQVHALSNRNKVTLLLVPGQSGIQGNEVADALARDGSNSSSLSPKPAVSMSPCVDRLKDQLSKKLPHRL
jgi:ribonuclease HI